MINVLGFLKNPLSRARTVLKGVILKKTSRFSFSRLTKLQWLYMPRLFSRREKIVITAAMLALIISGAVLLGRVYFKITEVKPAFGGTYREGLLKEPRFINPIYASSNDTDRDITELVFSGLVRYAPDGGVEPDLAESIEISDDGTMYTVLLRDGLRWHDGEELNADDVIFTIKMIQNPEFKSSYRQNWQGVAVEKIDERTLRFSLKQPYAPFVENLTIGIIPEHLWSKIAPQSALLSDLNLKPVGAGPYRFHSFTRSGQGTITSYVLTAYRAFHGGRRARIKEITFAFYPSEDELIAAYRKGEIDGISILSAKNLPELKKTDAVIYAMRTPRIIGLFFNSTQQEAFDSKNVRLALAHAVDVNKLIEEILDGGGEKISSPIPPVSMGFSPDIPGVQYAPERAAELLDKAGWKNADENGIREKTETKNRKKVTTSLKIEISTSEFPELVAVADAVKEMWGKIGVDAEVKVFNSAELETLIIRPRAYQVLLFGEIFGHDPDPFAFWHTSQIKDPGLNIALYSNRKADSLLEEARRTTDEEERKKKYQEFQEIVAQDAPAVFLLSPLSFYAVRSSVRGVNVEQIALPHERFSRIEEWYVKTRRGLK